MREIISVILLLINVYQIVLLLRVLLSWFRVDPYTNPVGRLLYALTEPVLEPIRQVLPSAGMMDFSPLVAFLLLFALRSVIVILAAGI